MSLDSADQSDQVNSICHFFDGWTLIQPANQTTSHPCTLEITIIEDVGLWHMANNERLYENEKTFPCVAQPLLNCASNTDRIGFALSVRKYQYQNDEN